MSIGVPRQVSTAKTVARFGCRRLAAVRASAAQERCGLGREMEQRFDGHVALELQVPCAVDDSHAAGAEAVLEAVFAGQNVRNVGVLQLGVVDRTS